MKLRIWDKNTKTVRYGTPDPSYEVELEGGEVIEIENNGDCVLHMELKFPKEEVKT